MNNPVTFNNIMRRDGMSERRGVRQHSPFYRFIIADVLHLTQDSEPAANEYSNVGSTVPWHSITNTCPHVADI